MKTISQQVDHWIDELELPPRANLKVIRENDGLYPDDPVEAEAYWDFIKWYLQQNDKVLQHIPERETIKKFAPLESDNALSFPFSSRDFLRDHPNKARGA